MDAYVRSCEFPSSRPRPVHVPSAFLLPDAHIRSTSAQGVRGVAPGGRAHVCRAIERSAHSWQRPRGQGTPSRSRLRTSAASPPRPASPWRDQTRARHPTALVRLRLRSPARPDRRARGPAPRARPRQPACRAARTATGRSPSRVSARTRQGTLRARPAEQAQTTPELPGERRRPACPIGSGGQQRTERAALGQHGQLSTAVAGAARATTALHRPRGRPLQPRRRSRGRALAASARHPRTARRLRPGHPHRHHDRSHVTAAASRRTRMTAARGSALCRAR